MLKFQREVMKKGWILTRHWYKLPLHWCWYFMLCALFASAGVTMQAPNLTVDYIDQLVELGKVE